MKVIVIGAGPAGLTAAYQLAEAGIDVVLLEASDSVGGMAKSITIWNQRVDLGPHRFFSSHKKVVAFWLKIIQKDYHMVNRHTRILYNHNFFHYPLQPKDTIKGMGFYEGLLCLLSYARQKLIRKTEADDFKTWVIQRFGNRLYNTFFKTYSEKLWGIPCDQLDADFAAQRIKKLTLYEALKNSFKQKNSGKHRTLADEFAYPNNGSGELYERIVELLKKMRNVEVHLNCKVTKLLMKDNTIQGVSTSLNNNIYCDKLISTMPLSSLVTNLFISDLDDLSSSLSFRSNVLIYVLINNENVFDDQWLYVHSESLKVGRISNFNNWGKSNKQTVLCMEYWCNEGDRFWEKSNSELADFAYNELSQTGLVKKNEIVESHIVRIEKCYPVYFKGYRKILNKIAENLAPFDNLQVIGRYGSYKYNNQDHSIYMGMLASENLLGAKHNLWEVNTDYENYQEAAIITETGICSK